MRSAARLVLATFLLATLLSRGTAAAMPPPPAVALAALEGGWTGTLEYSDYRSGKRVVLPTEARAALAGAATLAVHFVYDDGPGKTVHSYERLALDPDGEHVRWESSDEPLAAAGRIVERRATETSTEMVFEQPAPYGRDRYTLVVAAAHWSLRKEEVRDSGVTFRHEYRFRRVGEAK
jgi:hypothetical protein